jgi:hypothetical protein
MIFGLHIFFEDLCQKRDGLHTYKPSSKKLGDKKHFYIKLLNT